MPDLSQRTLAHVMKVLGTLVPEDADTYPLSRDFWQQTLFKWGFPAWLIDYAAGKSFSWTQIVRGLFAGEVKQKTDTGYLYQIPQLLQETMLKRLTVMAISESQDFTEQEQLRRSLLLDGFEVSQSNLVSVEGPISVTKEKSRLLTKLGASAFARRELIATHLKNAEDLFAEGNMHPALGEARSALQAGIEDTVALVESSVARKSGGGVRNQIEFLAKENFVSADEQQAFLAAWGFLSAGAHPGLPPDEVGRIGLIFGLEFTQVLLIKANTLL